MIAERSAPLPFYRRGWRPAACILAGTAIVLSCVPWGLWPLAWVALCPTLLAIRDVPPRRAFLLGWLTGLAANAGGFYWICSLLVRFGHMPLAATIPLYLLLVAYQAVELGLWAYVVRRLAPHVPAWIAAPCVLVVLELGFWMLFPWYYAITQSTVIPVIQVAELGGPTAVTFLLVLVNGAIAELMVGGARRWKPLAVATGVVAAALLWGHFRMRAVEAKRHGAPKLKVGVVQGNFGILDGPRRALAPTVLRVQREMSADLERRGAELIVWPESAYPYAYGRDQWRDFADDRAVMRGFRTPAIIGALTWSPRTRYPYNSALFLEPAGRISGRFDKNYLLLFGEYIPLYESIPWFQKIFPEASNLARGHDVTTFALRDYRIAPLICYEDIIPAFGRRVAALKPHLFVNITNDAWFGRTSEPWQHLALAVFRSVEHRVDMVRSVLTGVSAYIDATGRVYRSGPSIDPRETPDAERTALLDEVALMQPSGIYGRVGDLFAYCNVAATLGFVAFAIRRRYRGANASM